MKTPIKIETSFWIILTLGMILSPPIILLYLGILLLESAISQVALRITKVPIQKWKLKAGELEWISKDPNLIDKKEINARLTGPALLYLGGTLSTMLLPVPKTQEEVQTITFLPMMMALIATLQLIPVPNSKGMRFLEFFKPRTKEEYDRSYRLAAFLGMLPTALCLWIAPAAGIPCILANILSIIWCFQEINLRNQFQKEGFSFEEFLQTKENYRTAQEKLQTIKDRER